MRHEEILGLLPRLKYGDDYSPGLRLFGLELAFWIVALGLTWALLRSQPAWIEHLELTLARITQRKKLWLVGFALIVIVVRTALLPWIPVPVPVYHDEFSYLLGSDTFAHGRLTNAPSPMWVHFESFHINVLPTYQSMYPPGQGLTLALGQVLTGTPWFGVVLSTAVMCAAIYWMLLGWLPPQWAWLGGAFAVVRYGIFSYWINSYWGGSVAAIGGALVLGAFPRLRREMRTGTAVTFAAGLLILAITRPLEGFLFSLPIVISTLLAFRMRVKSSLGKLVVRLAPAMALLVVGLAGMLYYNWRGTGSPLTMPYLVNFKTYHISKPYFFQAPNPIPQYRHQVMRTFYIYHELADVSRLKYQGLWHFAAQNATVYYAFFLWPFLLLVAPGMYAIWRSDARAVLISMFLLAANVFAQIWPPHSHYVAPAAGAVMLVVLLSLKHFREAHAAFGLWASRALVMLLALWMLSPIAERLIHPYGIVPITDHEFDDEIPNPVYRPIAQMPLEIQRERIEAELENRHGTHLVIVHHPYHDVPSIDWVYNKADINHAKVVWARDMGYLKNQELIDYYPDRQVWYVDRSDPMARIVPYDEAIEPWKLALGDHASHQVDAESAHQSRSTSYRPTETKALLVVSHGATSR